MLISTFIDVVGGIYATWYNNICEIFFTTSTNHTLIYFLIKNKSNIGHQKVMAAYLFHLLTIHNSYLFLINHSQFLSLSQFHPICIHSFHQLAHSIESEMREYKKTFLLTYQSLPTNTAILTLCITTTDKTNFKFYCMQHAACCMT